MMSEWNDRCEMREHNKEKSPSPEAMTLTREHVTQVAEALLMTTGTMLAGKDMMALQVILQNLIDRLSRSRPSPGSDFDKAMTEDRDMWMQIVHACAVDDGSAPPKGGYTKVAKRLREAFASPFASKELEEAYARWLYERYYDGPGASDGMTYNWEQQPDGFKELWRKDARALLAATPPGEGEGR